MILELDEHAEEELAQAAEWYESRGHEGLGARLIEAVDAALRTVSERPETFAVLLTERDVVVRRHLVTDFPYQVVFTIRDDGTNRSVWVFAIGHLRREPGYWTERMP